MRIINAGTAALLGILTAVLIVPIDLLWPAFVIGVGATVTGLSLLARRGGRKYYAAAGSAYTLGLAVAIKLFSRFPTEYGQSPFVALVGFGLLGAVIVALQRTGRRVVEQAFGRVGGEEYAGAMYDAVAAVVGLLGLVWTVLTIEEKAARYGGLGLGTTGALVLNLLGAEFNIPIWFLTEGVDAVILVFVGCVLIGFHTLESLHTTWHATKATAGGAASAAQVTATRAQAVGGAVSDRARSTQTDEDSSDGDSSSDHRESDEPQRKEATVSTRKGGGPTVDVPTAATEGEAAFSVLFGCANCSEVWSEEFTPKTRVRSAGVEYGHQGAVVENGGEVFKIVCPRCEMTDDVHVSERTTVDHQPSTWRGTPLEDWVYGVGVFGGTVFITLLVFISGSDIGRAFLSGITSFVGFAVVLIVPWGIARAIRGTGST